MASAELVDGRIELDIDPHKDKLAVRAVPGRKYDLDKQLWWVPLSWASCVALRGAFGTGLEVGPELTAWARDEVTNRVEPAMAARDQLDFDFATNDFDPENAGALYPFQRAGVRFLSVAKRALLADEMGIGKTVQAINALYLLDDAFPVLVVCPNSVKRHWKQEFERWAPDLEVQVYQPGAKGKKAIAEVADGWAHVLVINWENTWRLSRLAGFGSIKLSDKEKEPGPLNDIPWGTVIADEAHRAKEPKAKQTRALWAVMWEAKYRFALSGTPVANSPRDLWSIMHGLVPEEFPAYTLFVDRYGLQSWNGFGGLEVVGLNPSTKDELFKFLDPRFLRRSKKLVLPHLPKKIRTKRYCKLSGKQKKAYKELKKEMLTELDDGTMAFVTNAFAKVARLRQLAVTYVEVTDDNEWIMKEPSGKLDELDAVLEEAGDQQVVVFAEHKQPLDLYTKRLEKRDIPYGRITGSENEYERQEHLEAFKAGKSRVMLCTLGAGGEGVDGLQAASIVVFLQRSYSMIKDKQAEDRLHRMGQERPVQVIDLVSEDTIEERVFEVLEEKGGRLEEVCRDEESLRRLLDD